MKIITSIIVSVTLLLSSTANSQTSDFRNAKWGMGASDVKSSEKSKLASEENNRIVYDDQLINIKAKVVYTFTGSDHLMRAKYF